MFELIILLSRYLFLFFIVYFLWQALTYLMDERDIKKGDRDLAASNQRTTIVLMHITAFLILAYVPDDLAFDRTTLITGGAGLVLLILGNILVRIAYKGSCELLWNGMFFLIDTGLIMLERVQRIPRLQEIQPNLAQRQLIWCAMGLAGALLIPLALKLIPKFEKLEKVYMVVSYFMILTPFVLGQESGGAINRIVFKGIAFQPSEIVKFLFVFYLASAFRKKTTFRQWILPAVLSAGIVLVLALQTDLGGALIFFMTFMIMFYISTGSSLLFFAGMGLASGASCLAYSLFSHVKVRVAAWQNPWQDIDGGGYQIVQSLFAIGTWGLLGSGLTLGSPGLVPVVESDFIFSAVCEELGSLFGIALIGVFIMIFYRGVHISLRCSRRYYALLAAGFTGMLAFQTFLILGGVIKLIPLTGVTLPFVSYGGSSIVVSILMLGIIQWIYMYNKGS